MSTPNKIIFLKHLATAKTLMGQNEGRFPSCTELKKRGLMTFYYYTKKYSILFRDPYQIDYHKMDRLAAHIKTIEDLALANGGSIPSCTYLMDNGHFDAYVCMMKYPLVFNHLFRDRERKENG